MENIALAFSGGGFRAASYSLGCLSLLQKLSYSGKPLLEKVKFISSTSGGSITNLFYSSYLFEGKAFQECYDTLKKKLTGQDLLDSALANLQHSATAWKNREEKNINVINAFSLEYDKLFEGKTLGLFSDRSKNPHLEEICVNSTEFTNGYAFRFQSQNDLTAAQNGWIGNEYIHFESENIKVAKKIRLADILAASSCFPSGFEPMIFPQDFTSTDLNKQELIGALHFEENHYTLPDDDYNSTDFFKDKDFKKEIQFGIMDGGVADNQAIKGFMLADERRVKNGRPAFDLFISCDVTSYFMDGYTLPVQKKKWFEQMSLNTSLGSIIVIYLLIAIWFPLFVFYFNKNWQWWNVIPTAVSGLFFISLVWILFSKFKGIFKKKTQPTGWSVMLKKYRHVFTSMSIGRLKQLLLVRAKSVFILADDVYLKQIRRMYYEMIFGNEKYKKRSLQNSIYDLSEVKKRQGFPDYPPPPSDAMVAVAEKSRGMGTTLWFDINHEAENMRNNIIATGQFTTCYKLLKHLNKMDPELKTAEILNLEKQLLGYYKEFIKDPFWMV